MWLYLSTLLLLALAEATSEYSPVKSASLSKDSFFEQFLAPDLASSGWIPSELTKADGSSYLGKWGLRELYKHAAFPGEKGLVMMSEANYFAISKELPFPMDFNGQDLVLQYEVKFQEGVTCGGGYVKLMSDTKPEKFSDKSRYEVMFGPDICGSQNRVHLLVKQEKSEDSKDSGLRAPPMAKNDVLSALYTLIIRSNHDMEIRINGDVAKAGNLLNTPNLMVPPILAPEYIPDPAAEKPEDWDDRQMIFNVSAEKPADYEERYNRMWMYDPAAKKPDLWNDDESEPLIVPDPAATKPVEWIDEEDGVWEAPLIPNPKCQHGCGKWEAPRVVNPDYKGEWVPPVMENPDYQGEWEAPLIKNPEFGKERDLGLRPINAIGIDVWSMQLGVMFSNIYLGHSVAEAEKIGNETFCIKTKLEYADYKQNKPRAKHEPRAPPKTFDDFLEEKDLVFSMAFWPIVSEIATAKAVWHEFQREPIETLLKHPFRFAFYCFWFVISFTIVFGLANVLFFLFLSSREEAVEHDRKVRAGEQKRLKKDSEGENIARIDDVSNNSLGVDSNEKLTNESTGKSTGIKVTKTTSKKIR